LACPCGSTSLPQRGPKLTREVTMSRWIAFLFAAALITAHATAPASAQNRRFVGTTEALFDGGQGHFAPHVACQAQFHAVWCTSQMIIENGPHPSSLDPPALGAWVNPTPTGLSDGGFSRALDFSMVVAPPDRLNCDGWRTTGVPGGALGDGLAIAAIGGLVVITTRDCLQDRPAACCGTSPFDFLHQPTLMQAPANEPPIR
jgi:hypothetical protein